MYLGVIMNEDPVKHNLKGWGLRGGLRSRCAFYYLSHQPFHF